MLDSVLKQIKSTILKKIKTENYIDEDLEKSESDSASNDETESDINNDEYGK